MGFCIAIMIFSQPGNEPNKNWKPMLAITLIGVPLAIVSFFKRLFSGDKYI
jgi:hypothetical protein